MIINSLLDTDLYKLTMGQVALHQFPWVNVVYEFKCRNNANWTHEHLVRLREEIKHFCTLGFKKDELEYLSSIKFFKKSYIDFLRLYRPDINHITIQLINGELQLQVKGPWFLTVYWEVPLLAIISEIYLESDDEHTTHLRHVEACARLDNKLLDHENCPFYFADFGTRRRYSAAWQKRVVRHCKEEAGSSFVGTSNIMLAKEYGLKPIGTMAHEFLQVGQALDVPLIDSQKRMLQSWVDEYRGDLGIALTDVIGFDAFLKDFDLYFAKLYDGLRHDSGDPFVWANKAINHYKKLGIDPTTKTLVFSDGLNFEKATNIYKEFSGQTNVSFGIGTNLTNDFEGITPLQIVMKIVECNGRPVAKISDSPGKGMCKDEEYVKYLKKVFGVTNGSEKGIIVSGPTD